MAVQSKWLTATRGYALATVSGTYAMGAFTENETKIVTIDHSGAAIDGDTGVVARFAGCPLPEIEALADFEFRLRLDGTDGNQFTVEVKCVHSGGGSGTTTYQRAGILADEAFV